MPIEEAPKPELQPNYQPDDSAPIYVGGSQGREAHRHLGDGGDGISNERDGSHQVQLQNHSL